MSEIKRKNLQLIVITYKYYLFKYVNLNFLIELGTSTTHTRSEEQQRRAAEREGRRIRRMRMREIKAISKHADGMSSDEEVPETDASAFRNQLGTNNFINYT